MMNLFMKLKMVFDTIESFFKVLNFIIEYVKNILIIKKTVALPAKISDDKHFLKNKFCFISCESPLFLSGLL